MHKITGTVVRSYTADKFGKLTLEVKGDGKYPDKLDFKTFSGQVIAAMKSIGNGEEVTLDFALQSEKVLNSNNEPIMLPGKDGKEWPIKVPMLKITAISTVNAPADNDAVPF